MEDENYNYEDKTTGRDASFIVLTCVLLFIAIAVIGLVAQAIRG